MEGGADKRLRERGINGKEPEVSEGQAPRKTGGNGGKEGNGGNGREQKTRKHLEDPEDPEEPEKQRNPEGTGDGEGYISMREMDSLRWRSS